MKAQNNDFWWLVAIGVLVWWLVNGGGSIAPGPTPSKVDRVTFVYEKDSSPVPPAVFAALNKLNRERGIVATIFEEDTVDGSGECPEQYKAAFAKSRETGLPVLVVQSGAHVVNTVKDPKTEDDVLKAVP